VLNFRRWTAGDGDVSDCRVRDVEGQAGTAAHAEVEREMTTGQNLPRISEANAAIHEARIRRLEKLIRAGKDTGRYPVGMFKDAGRHQDDVEEYGSRYVASTANTGRQAR
jgi:hypothetical protein